MFVYVIKIEIRVNSPVGVVGGGADDAWLQGPTEVPVQLWSVATGGKFLMAEWYESTNAVLWSASAVKYGSGRAFWWYGE